MTIAERRKALLDQAIHTNGPAAQQALAEAERLAEAAPRDVTDRACCLALLAHLARPDVVSGSQLLDLLAADPALTALGRAPQLTPQAATALVTTARERAAAGGRIGLADVTTLRAVAGGDAFDELAGVVHGLWLAVPAPRRPSLERDVAVLLPVRLETMIPPEDDRTLWLRIVPDEASILRDDPVPKPAEASRLAAMWQETAAALTPAEQALGFDEWLDKPAGRQAFATLCSHVGAARAAWLTTACPPTAAATGTVTIDTSRVADTPPAANRVGGLPARLDVWWAFGDDAPELATSTRPDAGALVFDVIGAGPTAGHEATAGGDERTRWWADWAAAKNAGLGVEIPFPAGRSPDDLRTLYLIGISDEAPEALFRAQIDAGEVATLALGTPTNAVDGRQAAPLGDDPGTWLPIAQARLRALGNPLPEEDALTRSLAGDGADLPPLPRAAGPEDLDQTLVRALWPALWGHTMRDLWGCVEDADVLGAWATRHLRPEGPLPPLRIAAQPYGLLPTAALDQWGTAPDEGPDAGQEGRLCSALLPMRALWAAAARNSGTSVGASTERLVELVARDGVSAGYAHRPFLAVEVWAALYGSMQPLDQQRVDDWVHATFTPLYDLLGRGPDDPPGIRQLVTGGGVERLAIPLVVPTTWPIWYYENPDGSVTTDPSGNPVPVMTPEAGLVRLLTDVEQYGQWPRRLHEEWREVLPDSLLVRLALHSATLSAAAVAQVDAGSAEPIREPLVGDDTQPTVLESLSSQYDPNSSHDHPAGVVRASVLEGVNHLWKTIAEAAAEAQPAAGSGAPSGTGTPPGPRILTDVERALRATLDTAAHRLDPWLTGIAARRLEYLRGQPESRFRLGVYGWLDGPLLGRPGPTEGGLLHAPSHPQALTAAILRDKYVTESAETAGTSDRWSIRLESQRVRLAAELAEEVRLGSHVFEALGRRVEQIIGVRTVQGAVAQEAGSRIDTLRRTYPMTSGRYDRGRVCHGPDALAGLLGSAPPVIVTPAQRDRLGELQPVLDAYGDLLVAEAVHQVVSGQADRAGAAMDAAAGLATPPTLAFTETPLSGEAFTTAAVTVIPYRPAPTGPDPAVPPARIADTSVAEALPALAGAAADWTWQAPDGTAVTLDRLGLEPADTLSLSTDLLADLARAALGASPGTPLTGTGSRRHDLARDIVQALGGTPLFLRDVAPTTLTPAQADEVRTLDEQILAELRTRYATLRGSAQRMIDELAAARTAADPQQLRQALFRALRWGVIPVAADDDPRALLRLLASTPGAVGPEPQAAALAQRAEEALRARLAAVPPPDTGQPLGQAIAELAAPGGRLAVLTGIDAAVLARIAGLNTAAPEPGLDTEWLTVVASVRPRLAAVEALQLAAAVRGPETGSPEAALPESAEPPESPGFPGFTAWSSAPADPWQTAALAGLRDLRRQPGRQRLPMPRFVAAYTAATPGWQAGQRVAAALIDAWSDTAPDPDQVTTAAFGFNGPAARAPQAILLAVPADLGSGYGAALDTPELVDALAGTREAAHARAVEPDTLGAHLAVVPTITLSATGGTAVPLDTGISFPA
ncbi:hypothetical protein [Actinacidiphila acidipaludis]|uniref:Uncharacterized protein n=1 Tax=Actinacidiphila acidipaludis TaxID=2873382 RepID=A0ABS7Q325_9ACTN|nr:hypothetical protein [Streptomyces acidipaludis]MBY8877353.1 hypothetical protein [Streptomyces acidipaludis]